MARIVAYSSTEEPLLTSTDALHERAVEHLILRDTTGAYADIPAVCCTRCGYTLEFSTVLGTHRCTTTERQERLMAKGMTIFREIAERRHRGEHTDASSV